MKKLSVYFSLLTLLLFGCAEYTWVAPPSRIGFEAKDYKDCLDYVNRAYPEIPKEPPKIIGYKCYGSSFGSSFNFGDSTSFYGTQTIECSPKYNDLEQSFNNLAIGIRRLQREKALKECMELKGYRLERK